MKTPRFFIALAAWAVVFTIASSSLGPVVSPCFAGSLPILRVDPRMGDPDQPGGGYHELPMDDYYGFNSSVELELAAGYSPATRRQAGGWWYRIHYLLYTKVAHARGWRP